MSLLEVMERLTTGEMAGWAVVVLFLLLSLIQISPLKLNPWDAIFAWLGKKLNGATEKRLLEVEKQVSDMWINNHRQCILTFARECRQNIPHSSDEWSNVLNVAEEYESMLKKNISPTVSSARTHITFGISTRSFRWNTSFKMHGKRPCFILPKRQEREDFNYEQD